MTDKDTLIKQQNDFIQMALMPRMAMTQKTLRDEFAMAALAGTMANIEEWGDAKERAEYAYQIADAMMEARK